MKNLKFKNLQQGVSLIITFFIMIIILTVVLSISVLLYSEIKVIRNMSNSMVSFFAADSGIEKVLFYDRQVIPTGAKRGLCSMLDSSGNNPNYCASSTNNPNDPKQSIYCNSFVTQDCPDSLTPYPTATGGCDFATCTNCNICFTTNFDDRTYYTIAKISTDSFGSSDLEIDSAGSFGGAQRKIQILTTSAPTGQ